MRNYGKICILATKKRSRCWLRSRESIRLILCVHEIVQDELFDAVADVIHTSGIFHRVAAFEVFCDAFNLGVLLDQQVVRFLRVTIQIS